MFIGDYTGKIDAKGRMIIPSQFRKNCDGETTFILKQNIYDKALDLYPADAWKEEIQNFSKNLNPYNRTHAALLREYYRGTAEVSLDSAGRVLIPSRLINFACLDKSVIIAGAGHKVMIWNDEEYNASQLSQEEFENLISKELG